ncbi:MAG: tyrosine-type recombinase/integrase [Rhodopila sp.]|jgi:integrase
MPLIKFQRVPGGNWILRGEVRRQPVYESTRTSNAEAAETIRIKRENELLDESVFGKKVIYTFPDAVVSYLGEKERSPDVKYKVRRLLDHFKETKLLAIDQIAVDAMYRALVRPGKPGGGEDGKLNLFNILHAILEHAAWRQMCARPLLKKPKPPKPKKPFLFPEQATALVRAGALHLRPLLVFLISVGCRPSEALKLDWRDVDLKGGQATLILGKTNQKEHVVVLRPVALRALRAMPNRTGPVFRTWLNADGQEREAIGPGYRGRSIRTAWAAACARAGLPGEWHTWVSKRGERRKRFNPVHDPYSERHTFGTWHRCAYGNLQDLQEEIGWTTTRMGESYAKKMAAVYKQEILDWWNDKVDLGLAEVEAASCKIRAAAVGVTTPAPKTRLKARG